MGVSMEVIKKITSNHDQNKSQNYTVTWILRSDWINQKNNFRKSRTIGTPIPETKSRFSPIYPFTKFGRLPNKKLMHEIFHIFLDNMSERRNKSLLIPHFGFHWLSKHWFKEKLVSLWLSQISTWRKIMIEALNVETKPVVQRKLDCGHRQRSRVTPSYGFIGLSDFWNEKKNQLTFNPGTWITASRRLSEKILMDLYSQVCMEKSDWKEKQIEKITLFWIMVWRSHLMTFSGKSSFTGFINLADILMEWFKPVITEKCEFQIEISQVIRRFRNFLIKKRNNEKKEIKKR